MSPGVDHFLPIKDGRGDINLDYYSLTFKKHPTKTLAEGFKQIRRAYTMIVRGSLASPFGEEAPDFDFLEYMEGDSNSALAQKNRQLWASDTPVDAVMSFTLFQQYVFTMRAKMPSLVLKQGDVQATCSSPTDFIFSTVYTKAHTEHPVSDLGKNSGGIRGLGENSSSVLQAQPPRV
jgi:hypothetical protein